jgi:hypothetical protein
LVSSGISFIEMLPFLNSYKPFSGHSSAPAFTSILRFRSNRRSFRVDFRFAKGVGQGRSSFDWGRILIAGGTQKRRKMNRALLSYPDLRLDTGTGSAFCFLKCACGEHRGVARLQKQEKRPKMEKTG